MTSQTRGHKSHSRKGITQEQIRALLAMRRRGMTCEAVSKALGIGESTVARYSSAWYQNVGKKKRFENTEKPEKELTSEQIEYINSIYRSGDLNSGTFIGNLLIRIGKFFGGHNPV